MKYIDADKLKAELSGFRNIARERIDNEDNYFLGMAQGYDNSIDIIDSLQQEPPEVDLKKELKRYLISDEYLDTPENVSLLIARHFYELGLKARKED